MRPLPSLPSTKGSAEELSGPPTPPSEERKAAAPGSPIATRLAAAPAQPAATKVDYAALYRERFRREQAEEQATGLRRLRR